MTRRFFFGASENDNVDSFLLRKNGWKDLMMEKQVFIGSSDKMRKFLALLLAKIPG
ncbi:MAG: hypothetical protein F6K40_20345 [Okeania sp. SIO3I5]|uniref:hypothetical protein n=1 Tax=Okeania sp. SIO3I5 TaxID=2607805 RepID=UPI0013BA4857|nr:hypothetical protein [Okeania sp. SIO3I5]NEQ38489.1 hypothetical protein [Okeania sp. SIO3I5]